MTTPDQAPPPPPLRFRNFKGGDYRAPGQDQWEHRVTKDKTGTWSASERRTAGEAATEWDTYATGLPDRAAAEQACAARQPSDRAKEAAVRQLRAAVASRQDAQAKLAAADEALRGALVAAFDAGHTATPLLEVTRQAGITTRNRLYQIRDGRRT